VIEEGSVVSDRLMAGIEAVEAARKRLDVKENGDASAGEEGAQTQSDFHK
jgi:hypothetical protein